jgi:hypothetical protein
MPFDVLRELLHARADSWCHLLPAVPCCLPTPTPTSTHVHPTVITNASGPVTINAFRALAMLCPACPPAQLQPLLAPLLGSLVQLLAAAEEESLHLVLEVLEAVVAAAARAAAAGQGGISPEQAMAVAQPVLQVRPLDPHGCGRVTYVVDVPLLRLCSDRWAIIGGSGWQ